MLRRIRQFAQTLGYTTIVTMTMMATVWSSLGLVLAPHPEAGHQHDATPVAEEAYPCQGHGCGCQSAADCRSHCCCFGPASAPPASPAPSDAPSSQLSWRSAFCAGVNAWLMTFHKVSWLPMMPVATPNQAPRHEQVQRLSPQSPACHTLAVDPPPPRRSV